MSTSGKTDIDLTPASSLFDAAGPNVRPLVRFWEVVFTGSRNETPQKTDQVRDLVESSLADGYTFNGQKSTPADLMAFRGSLLDRFVQMRTVVANASSVPISSQPGLDAAVSLVWHAVAEAPSGIVEMRGANLIGSYELKAVSNCQVGDPAAKWQPVVPA